MTLCFFSTILVNVDQSGPNLAYRREFTFRRAGVTLYFDFQPLLREHGQKWLPYLLQLHDPMLENC